MLVVQYVVPGPTCRIVQDLVGVVNFPKPLLVPGLGIIGMVALGQQPEDALEGLRVSALAQLQHFVMVYELFFAHQEIPSVVSGAFCHGIRQHAG